MGGKEPYRPSLLRIFSSTGVTVRNLTLRNPRMWTQVYSECSGSHHRSRQGFRARWLLPESGRDGHLRLRPRDDFQLRRRGAGRRHLPEMPRPARAARHHRPQQHDHWTSTRTRIKLGTATHGPIERIPIENNVVKTARVSAACASSRLTGRGCATSPCADWTWHVSRNRSTSACRTASPPPNDLQFSSTETAPAGSIDDVVIENVRSVDPGSATTPSCTMTGIPGARRVGSCFATSTSNCPAA